MGRGKRQEARTVLGRKGVYFSGNHMVHPFEEGTARELDPLQIVTPGSQFN